MNHMLYDTHGNLSYAPDDDDDELSEEYEDDDYDRYNERDEY